MVIRSGATLRVVIPIMPTTGLAAVTAPVALGATPLCRVRNVSQDTHGRSLIRMVERAEDGDKLAVRGTCPGEVIIAADISITSAGARRAVIDGRQRRRAAAIRSGAKVKLRRLVLSGGDACFAGGLRNSGTTTLVDSVIRDNIAGGGGGIANRRGTLRLIRSLVHDNTAEEEHQAGETFCTGPGGGIDNWATLTLIDSVVAGNRSAADDPCCSGGGGIANSRRLRIARSVIRDNAARTGGGIQSDGGTRLVLSDSLVTANTATVSGGGIHASGRTILRGGTSVAANTADRRGGGILNGKKGSLALFGSTVTANTGGLAGGGIWNDSGPERPGSVALDADSSVTGNTPDDCVGTLAC